MLNKLPLFYFRPTICWIDDNQLILDAANNLFKEDYNCLTFSDPCKALDFLISHNSQYSRTNFSRVITESETYDINNHVPIDINLSEITHLSDNKAIKNDITLLIIDNSMPNINGLEICHRLKDTPYKKILLTGETGPTDVIDAFNEGIINKFISKDKFFIENLWKSIRELTYEYFIDKTDSLISHIEHFHPSPLTDPVFIEFFVNWHKSNNLTEFYLLDKNGSFLNKNAQGAITYFILMSDYAKEEFIHLNDEAMNTTDNILPMVSKGELIPFFGIDKNSWDFAYSDWDKYFYPANILKGRETYYWTSIRTGDN